MNRRGFVKKTILSSMTVSATSAISLSSNIKPVDLHTNFKNDVKSGLSDSYSEPSLVRVVDLDIREDVLVKLHDGTTVQVKLLSIEEKRESVFQTLMETVVNVEINGKPTELISNSYRLPIKVGGVQVDVPVVNSYMKDTSFDWWRLKKAVRFRFWPAESPWIEPGTFMYPVKQRWFASKTWYSNEPISPMKPGSVYYHAGMDLGATEGLTEIVAATEGVIIVLGEKSLDDKPKHKPVISRPRRDVIYIKDKRGWIYRYSHLKALDPTLRLGSITRIGQRLGYVGKEGGSGGWSHLHFHIESLQPSGELGVEDSYAFLWQAYRDEYDPQVLAVARPHQVALPGETVILDASRSWAKTGIHSFEWIFTDGTKAAGPTVKRIYNTPGTYSEIVKITDEAGNIDYDFMRVNIYPKAQTDTTEIIAHSIPELHTVYHPTFGIKPGDPVIFRSRGFHIKQSGGNDIYDFGDGSPKVSNPSNIDKDQHATNGYGMVIHHYQKPGHYIVRVERIDEETGYEAVQHLHVVIDS